MNTDEIFAEQTCYAINVLLNSVMNLASRRQSKCLSNGCKLQTNVVTTERHQTMSNELMKKGMSR